MGNVEENDLWILFCWDVVLSVFKDFQLAGLYISIAWLIYITLVRKIEICTNVNEIKANINVAQILKKYPVSLQFILLMQRYLCLSLH